MKRIFIKIIFSIVAFLFAQEVILPWAISNNSVPLWFNIVLISFLLMGFLCAVDRIAFYLIKALRKNHEAIE